MSATSDILKSWTRPREVVRQHMNRGQSEPFAFTLLLAFLILVFISLWPLLSRQSLMQPEVPMVQRLVASALAVVATIPLWYGLALISHWIARVFGGQGSGYGARLALFAALMAVGPGMLLRGLVAGIIGAGVQANLVSGLVGIAFLWMWISMLYEVER